MEMGTGMGSSTCAHRSAVNPKLVPSEKCWFSAFRQCCGAHRHRHRAVTASRHMRPPGSAGEGKELWVMYANSMQNHHFPQPGHPRSRRGPGAGAGPRRTHPLVSRCFPFPPPHVNPRSHRPWETGDNGSCYLGQRRGNDGWHRNCRHYVPEPTLPIYTSLSAFALGRCGDMRGLGD